MKRLLLTLLIALGLAGMASAQVSTTSVSGTISDANGQAFASGTWSAVLIAASGGTGQPFVCNGITLTSAQVQRSGSLDSSGAFTDTMVSNSCISPSGSLWSFSFNPASTSAPYTQSVFIFGSTQSLTSTITPPAIVVNNSAVFTIAYTDAEVFGFKEGSFYWNVLTPALRVYHSGAWQGIGGGGGSGTVTNIATTGPITGGPITTTGTIGCATCGVTGTGLGQFAATTSAQLAGVISDGTGTGALVFGTSPTLVTPALGTPSSVNLANATFPASIALTTGNLSQFAATTSSQLAAVISDETGTGALVFANTPTLVTPALGAATGTSLALGTAPAGCAAITGCIAMGEQATAGTPTAGTDYIRADSGTHNFLISLNGGAETAIGSGSGTVTNIATSSPLGGGPITTTGTLTCTTCTTNASANTSNVLAKGGGLQAIQNSSITDNATTVTTTDTGGYVAPTFVSNGTGAGALVMTAGAAQGHATTSTVTLEAGATATAYEVTLPIAAATGIPLWTNTSNVVAETISATVPVAQGGTGLASGTSGGILAYTATGTLASSAALTANVLIKGGGAGVVPAVSLITENGTSATYTGTGGYIAPKLTSNVATGTAPLVITSTTTVPNLTVSNHPKVQFCGTTSTCSATPEVSGQVIFGSAALVTGTPSTVTISGISPAFTATADYVCTVSAPGATAATALLGVTNVSASSFTITGPAAVTTVVSYQCVGF